MIEMPLGKAVVAVSIGRKYACGECFYFESGPCAAIKCRSRERKDGQNVIFKIVDYPTDNGVIDAEKCFYDGM